MKRWLPLLLLAVGMCLAGVVLVASPRAALVGWLAGFVVAGAAPLGATAWLLIARLTGGGWSAPLVPVARMTPWLLVAGLPLAIGSVGLTPPPHLRLYLWPPLLVARDAAAVALLGWAAWRVERSSVTAAALLLMAYGVIVSMLGVDWLLVVEPGHAATVAGMLLAVVQLLAGIAVALVVGWGTHAARANLGRLLVAPVLAVAYMLFVDGLIVWYGNIPSHARWYVDRLAHHGLAVPLVALLAVPGTIAAVALDRLRLAGAVALGGTALAMVWWIGGAEGWPMAVAALGGGLATGALASLGWREGPVHG